LRGRVGSGIGRLLKERRVDSGCEDVNGEKKTGIYRENKYGEEEQGVQKYL
jgi:hypothetical protein